MSDALSYNDEYGGQNSRKNDRCENSNSKSYRSTQGYNKR